MKNFDEYTVARTALDSAVDTPPSGIACAGAIAARPVVVALSVATKTGVARVTRTNSRIVELSSMIAHLVTITTHPTLKRHTLHMTSRHVQEMN